MAEHAAEQLTPAPAPGDERCRGEAGDQADDAEGQDPAGIVVAGIAHSAQREEERAKAEERCGDAEHAINRLHVQDSASVAAPALAATNVRVVLVVPAQLDALE